MCILYVVCILCVLCMKLSAEYHTQIMSCVFCMLRVWCVFCMYRTHYVCYITHKIHTTYRIHITSMLRITYIIHMTYKKNVTYVMRILYLPDPINHACSLPAKYISKKHFTYRSTQIFRIMFQGFILKNPTKIWSSAPDHALLHLLLNTVGFFISARQKSA